METASRLTPLIGDFCCVDVGGEAGELIKLGERLNGHGFSQYEHVFIYVGGMHIVQAAPGGARETKLTRHGLESWSTGKIPLTADQRLRISIAARNYIGTPYSIADYLQIAAHRIHLPIPGLRDMISDSGHLICSQLVDQCYQDAGVQLFTDNRWPGYVTPADLAGLIA